MYKLLYRLASDEKLHSSIGNAEYINTFSNNRYTVLSAKSTHVTHLKLIIHTKTQRYIKSDSMQCIETISIVH